MKSSDSCPAACPPFLGFKFLGVLLLLMGLGMLYQYTTMVNTMLTATPQLGLGGFDVVVKYLGQLVAYTWPFLAALVGLSYLVDYKKCWASLFLMIYLALFTLAHVWGGQIAYATYDLLFAFFVFQVKSVNAMCK